MRLKNNFFKRICSCLVMLMMALSFFVNFNVYADEVNDNIKTFTGDGFEIVFQMVNQWDGAYNGNVTVKNVSDKTIENWAIKFSMDSEITNIWGANIADKVDSEYVITNAGWNQDIAPNSEVSFGFTANYIDTITMPEEFFKLGAEVKVTNERYSIESKVLSQWGNSYNGEVTITNISDEAIEDWELFFDLNSEITSIWNAEKELIGGTKYHIKNCGYNSGIKPGQSVTFGYQATTQEDEVTAPTNILLAQYEATADVRDMYEADVDGDGLPDYYEREYGTDPYLEDTDGNGINDGDEKYHTVISSEDDEESPSNVSVTVEMDAEGKQLNTIEVVKIPESDPMLSSNIPGCVGNAYELNIDGDFNNATIKFTVKSQPDSDYEPCLYYYNEDEQWLRKV